jgi:hypothetical protein
MTESRTTVAPQPESAPLMLRVEGAAKLSRLDRTKFLELLYAGEVPGVARFGRARRGKPYTSCKSASSPACASPSRRYLMAWSAHSMTCR